MRTHTKHLDSGLHTREERCRACGSGRPCRAREIRAAFTMVEAVFSVALVGGLVVTALHSVGASKLAQKNIGEHRVGQALALELMTEILQQAYADPDETPTFGVESTETAGDREKYDDVDDYAGYSEDSIKSRSGVTTSGYSGWTRTVAVQRVSPSNVTMLYVSDAGLKRITVTALHNGVTAATLKAVRTDRAPLETGGFEIE